MHFDGMRNISDSHVARCATCPLQFSLLSRHLACIPSRELHACTERKKQALFRALHVLPFPTSFAAPSREKGMQQGWRRGH
mmetsp:Transcript_16757/g.34055  ORF Transcript_16757/g.34055 Transcript_16757/m.34055 type:complete len:81 (-) Transcript_16757:106-348(-)